MQALPIAQCDESKADKKASNEQVAQQLYNHNKTVDRLKQWFAEEGFKAHLIAFSCSKALEGYSVEGKRMGNTGLGKQ